MIELAERDEVAEVARRTCRAGHPAVLCVEIMGDVGYLFFSAGELIHAVSLDLEGDRAAVEILSWQGARLSFCERRWPRARSVTQELGQLLQQSRLAPAQVTGPARPLDAVAAEMPSPRAEAVAAPAIEPRLPTPAGLSRALRGDGFASSLFLDSDGRVHEARGHSDHLKPIIQASLRLGDSFGEAFGLGPLVAVEAAGGGLHRIVARSSEGAAAAEAPGSGCLQVARAFLKL